MVNLNINWEKIFNFDSSCVIVVPVDQQTASSIYLNGGEDVEELHITLLYFPDKANLVELHNACKRVSERFPPFETYSQGVGSFDTGENKTIHLNMADTYLSEIREALMEEVDGYSTKFPDYNPHITLAYVDKETPLPEIPETTLKVDSIEIWNSGGFRFSYPLKKLMK